MVKKGPCCHCGTMEAVMWRKGPEDKPVLCNPCGARWISKKSLEGYMPMSAGGIRKSSKAKTSGHKNTKSKQAGQANGVNTSTLSRNKVRHVGDKTDSMTMKVTNYTRNAVKRIGWQKNEEKTTKVSEQPNFCHSLFKSLLFL